MRRPGGRNLIRSLTAGAFAAAALALLPAGASGVIDVWIAYGDLAPPFKPAPLVALSFPAALGPVSGIEVDNGIEGHGRYSLLFSHVIPPKHPGGRPGLAGDLILKSFGRVSLAKEARLSKPLYHVSSTTVRGRRAVLIRGRHTPTVALLWSESGSLYGLGTGTPKTVPLSELQRTATALERLVAQVRGETPPEDGYTGKGLDMSSRAVLGEHSALVEAGWTAECQEIPGNEFGPRGIGQTTVTVPLGPGGSLSFGPVPVTPEGLVRNETAAWTLSVAGSLAPSGGQLTESATGTSNGRSCTVGFPAFPLAPFHEA